MSDAQIVGDAKAINDARALLAALIAGDQRDVYVRSGDTEIFIARQGGRSNPMRAEKPNPTRQPGEQTLVADIFAPHVSNLIGVMAVGSVVESGDWVATISVLDEEHHVLAPTAGEIAEIFSEKGALLEYGSRILSISGT
jgi:acetyl-CoA carboxylase biotin carboxyl carrier protein